MPRFQRRCRFCSSQSFVIQTRAKDTHTQRQYRCSRCNLKWSSVEIHLRGDFLGLPVLLKKFMQPKPSTINTDHINKLLE